MPTDQSQRGFMMPLVLAVVFVAAAVGGGAYYASHHAPSATPSPTVSDSPTPEASASVQIEGGSQVMEFTMAGYQNAVKTGKLVILYYFANWCSDCTTEFPVFQSVISKLNDQRVVAFRVNFNDSETTDEEKAAAATFAVTAEKTKVIVKNGTLLLKNGELWDQARYEQEITVALP